MVEGTIAPLEKSGLVREKSKPARALWREAARGFVISESYLCFVALRHTLSGMRSRQSQVSKSPSLLKVLLWEDLAECLSQRSRRESIVAGSHRSQQTRKQPIDRENLQAWSDDHLDRGHIDAETNENQKCNESGEAWAHNSTSGGIANHPSATYTAPGLPVFLDPLSRQSQAIRAANSDRLVLGHPDEPEPTYMSLGSRGAFFVLLCATAGMGEKSLARGVRGAELPGSQSRQIFTWEKQPDRGMPFPDFSEDS